MEITQIIVRKRFETGGLIAVVSVIFNNSLAVHNVKIAYRPNGRAVVVMPKDSRGRDVVHPINTKFRENLEEIITKKILK